ncbi:MAG TPA: hypothetical protein VFB99_15005 [Vicinamibacterales bacterium]|nr:hypothetical protein [Vicinamibacterales bacterium]
MIRVMPLGGEPVELPEDTACYAQQGTSDFETARGTGHARMLETVVGHRRLVFVHIGDAWPLCEIETWRQRAERLERELAAMRDRCRCTPDRAALDAIYPPLVPPELDPETLAAIKAALAAES